MHREQFSLKDSSIPDRLLLRTLDRDESEIDERNKTYLTETIIILSGGATTVGENHFTNSRKIIVRPTIIGECEPIL